MNTRIQMQTLFRSLLLAAVLGLLVGGLNACNTTEGVGEDLEEVGEEIDEEF